MDDRERWNQRFLDAKHTGDQPSVVIDRLAEHFPEAGRALDLAGGAGRHALWLAARGYEATLMDVSDVGLKIAEQRARVANVPLQIVQHDLVLNGMPPGQWDLILSCLFLHRPLLPAIAAALSPGGRFVMLQPTKTNLERSKRPPAAYLLDDGELPSLMESAGLRVVHTEEGWLEDQRHDAVVVAERPAK